MQFEIITQNATQLSGLSVELSLSQQTNYHIIYNHWKKFNAALRINKVTLGSNWQKFGITTKKGDTYFYTTAISFNSSNNNFELLHIEGGNFALFQHIGSMNSIKNSIYNIYKNVIPNSNLKIERERELIHYEFYDSRFNWNKSNSIIDIFVPIIKI